MFALVILAVLGFAALGVDLSMIRLAQSQTQDVADAASQAAVLQLRRTGSTVDATQAATNVVARNKIVGGPGSLDTLEFGIWDDVSNSLTISAVSPNGARATVGYPVPAAMSKLWGYNTFPVTRTAISAGRTLHVILVIDITNSWSQANFANARAASVVFFDTLAASYGPDDRIGMSVFTGKYGVQHTPLQLMSAATAGSVRADWSILRTASKAGNFTAAGAGGCAVSANGVDNFANEPNGCYPNMWREYLDESGTDHTTGMVEAMTMFAGNPDPLAYRAMVILTDGNPNGVGAHVDRAAAGYNELRWAFHETGPSRNTAQVITDSATVANAADAVDINIWAVSFVANAVWMNAVAKGDGYYLQTNAANALVPIFEDIAESLPMAIVQ